MRVLRFPPGALMIVAIVAAAGAQSDTARRPERVVGVPPQVTMIPDIFFPGAHAIWGATGQDSRGHIWFGITAAEIDTASAHLYEFAPERGEMIVRGEVVGELRRAGILRASEQQAKIHSRIVQGPPNHLYFASMDEQGENADGSRLPTWGGHLWRISLATNRWEHLLTTREALIAVAGGDRYIYALGYFGHVLYRYDTRTGDVRRTEVGSVDGHISRNLVADDRGHVFVPRLRSERGPNGERAVRVSLVEFGATFEEIQETPLRADHYLGTTRPTDAHGIVGLQRMADGSIFFTTHAGFLYRIIPTTSVRDRTSDRVPATVTEVSWMHPEGPSYPASLFTPDGTSTLYSLARRDGDSAGTPYQWLHCDLKGDRCSVSAFRIEGVDPRARVPLLYGSSTRDGRGGHYVVGIWQRPNAELRPLVLRVQP